MNDDLQDPCKQFGEFGASLSGVALGYLGHILGDGLTKSGINGAMFFSVFSISKDLQNKKFFSSRILWINALG
ncbi:hypothetical protein HMPREF1430_00451 [Helicobacter pylori GAM96Ai]|uniref:hypothetical protein n=1 Tax=Helicobacter pylori TaxID=210 RepID=UPI0002BAA343|nr:hypothetical protein [Helicobacter pylori]EMH44278.1 hypothetical protein HMPREF1430_00451 [Helicobacter pylori GAM96Ai]